MENAVLDTQNGKVIICVIDKNVNTLKYTLAIQIGDAFTGSESCEQNILDVQEFLRGITGILAGVQDKAALFENRLKGFLEISIRNQQEVNVDAAVADCHVQFAAPLQAVRMFADALEDLIEE